MLAWVQMLPDGVAQPGRGLIYEGLAKLDGRYVLEWQIPSASNNRKVYWATYDPLTDQIFHTCIAAQTHYSVRKCGPQTAKRPYSKLCRHCKKLKAFLARHRKEVELTKATLIEVYALEAESELEDRRAS